jgi:spore germination protein D
MRRLLMVLGFAVLLAGCNNDEKTSTLSYDEIKKIMVDALQTEDGKKAVRELLNDQSFRDLVVLEHDEVETAMKTTLLSKDAEEFWKKTFEDPKFKETLAKSMKDQQEDVMKALMADAEYQEKLTKFFDQPDMQKQFESILKGSALRKQMEEVTMETIENPLLQTKWEELIRKSGEAAASTGKEGGSKSEEGKSEEGGSKEGGGGGQ